MSLIRENVKNSRIIFLRFIARDHRLIFIPISRGTFALKVITSTSLPPMFRKSMRISIAKRPPSSPFHRTTRAPIVEILFPPNGTGMYISRKFKRISLSGRRSFYRHPKLSPRRERGREKAAERPEIPENSRPEKSEAQPPRLLIHHSLHT